MEESRTHDAAPVILPFRSPTLYRRYVEATERWNACMPQPVPVISHGVFMHWMMSETDDAVLRALDKWNLPPQEWALVDLEADGYDESIVNEIRSQIRSSMTG